MNAKHTPTPWWFVSRPFALVQILGFDNSLLADVEALENAEETHANAALICTAVNEHEALNDIAIAAETAMHFLDKIHQKHNIAGLPAHYELLREQLANLATIRKGEK